ncbi:aminotransferase class IV [Ancylomarina sp. DW003]|nr:aminotransferase class IV [Ancylomarina sp. DW003]MDE5421733.1 aminotransferase class IV [Ancylomarina sp. DW003]
MTECSQYKYIHNSKLRNTSDFKDEYFKTGLSLYEVIRVINSKPIFLSEHLNRLDNSAKQVGQYIWLNYSELIYKIELAIRKNGVREGNIKIVFNIHQNNRNFYCYFVHHKYPESDEYKNGVSTVIYNAERRTPNAKIYNHELRSYTNTVIKSPDIFEVILLDNLNCVTEGSRSNLFFIKDDQLVTAPDDKVLNGIVRGKVLEISKKKGIAVLKENIEYGKLDQFQAAFLTGTSPQILPIRDINAQSFDVNHPLLKLLLETYRKELSLYVDRII